jgi:hypothetical protein
MKVIEDKVQETLAGIRAQLKSYKLPVLNCSFGKDSLALLHLLYSNGHRVPVIYYRDPWFPYKNAFANRVIDMWNIECHDYPPIRVSLKTSPQMVGLVSEYMVGRITTLAVLKNTLEYRDEENPDKYLCGANFLMRPCGTFTYQWDLALIAHKDCDEDPIYGPVPLHSDLVMVDDGPDCYFPFKTWTHDDVWDYIEAFGVPYQMNRYDLANRKEWDDKTFNSDWYETCVRCVDKRIHGQTVFCPKMQRELVNVSGAAAEFGQVPGYFGEKKQ